MLVGQQLGPFLIEKELGAGAMGAVYRGKYVKTGQLVAVKVMAPGLGTSSASSAARFEREAAILKQLHHPNIVRLFGVGKYKGTRVLRDGVRQGRVARPRHGPARPHELGGGRRPRHRSSAAPCSTPTRPASSTATSSRRTS